VIEASEFRDAKSNFEKHGVSIAGVSADPVKALQSFRTKRKLNFLLLSDPTHQMIEAYGAWRPKKFMGRIFKGIVRSSVLVGPTGTVEAIWPEVKAKGHAAEVMAKVVA
jgi:thioredoxin-dependent peroxiredoxin